MLYHMLQARQKISICYFYTKLAALGLSGSLDISSSSDNLKVKIQHTSYFNYIIHAYSLISNDPDRPNAANLV
jgi:hypothetical protein